LSSSNNGKEPTVGNLLPGT